MGPCSEKSVLFFVLSMDVTFFENVLVGSQAA